MLMPVQKITTSVSPSGSLNMLSHHEVERLRDMSASGLHEIFRRCSLAVLNCGQDNDNALQLMEDYADFDVRVIQQDRGVRLEVLNAPASAFVDGKMILGVRNHLFAVLRDIVYISQLVEQSGMDLQTSSGVTNFVFHILRNSGSLRAKTRTGVVVCWGGHSIPRQEYDYSKEVGYQMGLRKLHICTGCGAGAMKGPMKGAAIGHLKQQITPGRYIGMSEPGIIASESPNPIVNELVILPDIEKRLEAFVRLGHAFVIFPGGVGTTEEILFLLGILLHPENAALPFPLVLTGPRGSEAYFEQVDDFITSILGTEVRRFYQIIVGDPQRVARTIAEGAEKVYEFRRDQSDAYYFNWRLKIAPEFQIPFEPTHESMAGLQIKAAMDRSSLAYNLRRVFSGIVAGNVKANGMQQVKERGPFEINGDSAIMLRMDKLLEAFVAQGRMKLPGQIYVPCYRIKT
jgi:predicted Rossmann-fold nucleotide-binding protein